jgi:hypothetical protein
MQFPIGTRIDPYSDGCISVLRTTGFGDVIYGSVDPEKARQMAAEPIEHPCFSEDIPIILLSGRLIFEKIRRIF